MFVSLEKICFDQRPRGIQGDLQNQRQYVPTTTSDNRESYASALSKLLPTTAGTDVSTPDSNVDPPSSKAPSLYKVNDRVVIFDKSDIALHGTVKWTGRKNRLGRVIHVGIEMVCFRVQSNLDYPNSGPRKQYRSKYKSGHKLDMRMRCRMQCSYCLLR